mgnify:CR=1 FL=1
MTLTLTRLKIKVFLVEDQKIDGFYFEFVHFLEVGYHMDLILSHILVLGFTFHNIADWRYKNLCPNLIVLESKKIQMAAE